MKKKYMIRGNFLVLLFIFVCVFASQQASAKEKDGDISEIVPREELLGEAKKGIVEILSGFTDCNGKFHKMKSASGFLISNGENGAYIVANSGILKSTAKEKKAYCKENDLKAEDSQFTDVVQVVIRGDVTVEAQILTQSEELDFCILSLDSVVNEKAALKLGDSTLPVTGDMVFALGFPTDPAGLEFSEEEVEVYQGSVQDKASDQDQEPYIQHSAPVLEGNTGGPLLDADGYVIGINCFRYSDVDSGRYYALPVNKVVEILDNFAIEYSSRKDDSLEEELEALRKECLELYQTGDYKKESLKALEEALAKADKLTEQEEFQAEEALQVCQELQEAKKNLVPEMEKIQKVIYVLAGLIGLLCIWFLLLLMLNHKDKKRECTRQGESGWLAGNTELIASPDCQVHSGNIALAGAAEPMQSVGQREPEHAKEAENPSFQKKKAEQSGVWQRSEEQEKTIGLSYYRENRASFQKSQNVFSRRAAGLKLVRVRTGQAAEMDKPEYVIGKNPKQADFFVSDNQAVSRKHACIIWQEDAYCLSDLGSANGTYVRGEQLKEGQQIRLNNGDSVLLADEEFSVEIFPRKEVKNGIRD